MSNAPTPRGRRHAKHVGDRLTRSQIALRSGIDRETVAKYLAMKGAPEPDQKMRFSYKEALEWIDKSAPRAGAGANNEETKKLKNALLRAQVAMAEIELANLSGGSVSREKIVPAVAAFCTQLTQDMQLKFENELPPRYSGRTTIECQEMNAAAVDWVLRRLKEGAQPLVKSA